MESLASLLGPVIIIFLVLFVASACVRVLRQYERGVMFTLGRFSGVRGPGLILLIPYVQQIVRVDLRTVVMEIPHQDLISKDNVSVKVDAVLYFHVVDPEKAIIQVEQYGAATNMLAQTTLRSVLGQHELDEMLSKRATLNTDVQDILDERTKQWGIDVSAVEIRDIQLTDNMVQAIAKQAEAERDRRAKIIHADAEFQAAQTLTDAATILAAVPAAMQLRYLQTLTEIGGEHNSTVIFPMPLDVVKPFLDILKHDAAKAMPAMPAPIANGAKPPALS
jgi:regulator of protease activity HflC (stomatin/prohibitin superfamily)